MAETFVEIQPGNSATVECAAGATPSVKVGDLLPADAPAFAVIAVDGNKIVLGPLKKGENTVSIACSDGNTVAAKVSVAEVKEEDLPQKAPPLNPETLSYPLWLWLTVIFVLVGVIGGYWSWFVWKKRRQQAAAKRAPPPALNPEQKFQEFLKRASKERWSAQNEAPTVRKLYSEGYEYMRGFLEFKIGFKAPEATTKEFAGELKAALLRYTNSVPDVGSPPRPKIPSGFAGQVESLMFQADQVRFASENPPSENREAFLKGLEKVRTLS